MKIACKLAVAVALVLAARTAHAACDQVGHIPENTMLYHGSPAALFDFREVQGWPKPPPAIKNPNAPDGPAWFAFNRQFSLHAGLRYLVDTSPGMGKLTLHTYKVNQRGGIAALICGNHGEFAHETGLPVNDDGATARAFCNKYRDQYNAYRINADRVRGEPELIVCQPSQVLQHTSSEEWVTFVNNNERQYVVGNSNEAYELNLNVAMGGGLQKFTKIK
jgi:hypothetical protein